ncbi:MAG: hypothetical protein JWO48_1807 [Bryobacterales bacterium]|nr:hypothetical protein [Bryobacterales bacterium]
MKRMLKMAVAILPTTAIERWWFAYYLGRYLPDLNWWPEILIASAVFGLAHLFQAGAASWPQASWALYSA